MGGRVEKKFGMTFLLRGYAVTRTRACHNTWSPIAAEALAHCNAKEIWRGVGAASDGLDLLLLLSTRMYSTSIIVLFHED